MAGQLANFYGAGNGLTLVRQARRRPRLVFFRQIAVEWTSSAATSAGSAAGTEAPLLPRHGRANLPQTTRRRPGPTTKAEPAPSTAPRRPNELTCALVSRWLIIVAAPVRLDPLSPAIALSSLAVSLVRGNPLAQFRPAGRMAWERGAQPLSGLSGPRGIRGRTPAASTARPLYSGDGEAGMWGEICRGATRGPRGRRGGLWNRAYWWRG